MCPHRYHCAHLTGVHSISLPWVKNLSIAAEQREYSFVGNAQFEAVKCQLSVKVLVY